MPFSNHISVSTAQQKLCSIKKASQIIGVEYRRVLDAVNEGRVPHYQLGNSRKLVCVPEILKIMKMGE